MPLIEYPKVNIGKKPVHLIGHLTRSFHAPMMQASCGYLSVGLLIVLDSKQILQRQRFTLNPEKVTCNKCKHIIEHGIERDPVHRLGDKNHNCW